MAGADKCTYCQTVGFGKGTDDYGHIHCRMCNYRPAGYSSVCSRGEPATGHTWLVWCEITQGDMTVKEIPPTNRDVPSAFTVPKDMFRSPCRMIQVVVGKGTDMKTFVVHEPLLKSASAYFERALKSSFKEGQDNRVVLEEENSVVFGLLNEYLNMGEILDLSGTKASTNTMVCFSELWLLAHYLQMPKLLNYAIWRLLNWSDDETLEIDIPDVEYIYDKAPMDSMLRKFLVDLLVWTDGDLELSGDAPNLMLRDMVQELKRKCTGTVQSPLLDVHNYYTSEDALVGVDGNTKA